MRAITDKTNITLFIVLAFLLGGCSHSMNSGTDFSGPPNLPAADDKYSQEIVQLHQLVLQNSKPSQIKNVHLKLARLYSDHNNPNRNYHNALEHLQIYIRLEQSKVDGDTLNWLASLEEIDRLSHEITAQNRRLSRVRDQLESSKKEKSALSLTNRKLRREEIILRDKTRRLEESNQKLQKTIEMLKHLDQRLEEKRRNFSN